MSCSHKLKKKKDHNTSGLFNAMSFSKTKTVLVPHPTLLKPTQETSIHHKHKTTFTFSLTLEFLHLTKNIQLHQINAAVIRTVDTTYTGKTKDTEGGGLRNGEIRITREKKQQGVQKTGVQKRGLWLLLKYHLAVSHGFCT